MESPYLTKQGRLGDVIAAIQVMATYKFYKLEFEVWADRLSADRTRAAHWQQVFEDHPEFFRLDGQRQKASLVWRRQYLKRYSVDALHEFSKEQYDALDEKWKGASFTRATSASDIKTLIDTAINLHSRALEAQKHQQWVQAYSLAGHPCTFGCRDWRLGIALL